MVRLLILIIAFSTLLAGATYVAMSWWSAPHRRMLRQYRRMRNMILDVVEGEQRPKAERLLDDCEEHLVGLIRARKRLDVLDDMADAASDFAELETPVDREKLDDRLQGDVEYFINEMGRICAEVDYDWRESMRQLEEFADELETQREAFAQLEDLES